MSAAGPAKGRAPGRPRAGEQVDTQARALRVAQELFGEYGYAGVSMDQLAKAVGVNVRAIYHYYPSKRALFDAATAAMFEDYAAEVVTHVFAHESVRARLHGFVEVYRVLYRERRYALSFLSVVMTEGIAERRAGAPVEPDDEVVGSIIAMNGLLVDDAVRRGELAEGVHRDAAIALLQMVGMGLGLASLDEDAGFLAMLDALDLLIDGTLLLGE